MGEPMWSSDHETQVTNRMAHTWFPMVWSNHSTGKKSGTIFWVQGCMMTMPQKYNWSLSHMGVLEQLGSLCEHSAPWIVT